MLVRALEEARKRDSAEFGVVVAIADIGEGVIYGEYGGWYCWDKERGEGVQR